MAAEPFEPYTIAAVELEDEHIVVLGQVEAGTDPATLRTGAPMELTLATLFSDDAHDYVVWKWRPVSDSASGAAS
jgi:hypothetical protein